jgi:hypothetical protein
MNTLARAILGNKMAATMIATVTMMITGLVTSLRFQARKKDAALLVTFKDTTDILLATLRGYVLTDFNRYEELSKSAFSFYLFQAGDGVSMLKQTQRAPAENPLGPLLSIL